MLSTKIYILYILRSIILLLFFVNPYCSFSQKDTAHRQPAAKHSPKKAAVFSAIIPGAGQIYNRKYWKAPVVWTLVGGSLYYLISNQKTYVDYRDNYRIRVDKDPNTTDNYLFLTDTQLKGQRDNARQTRDLSVLIVAIVYSLNIIDASVDGNLYNFDVSDNLSMNIRPSYYKNPLTTATSFNFSCSLQFKTKPVYGF